MSLKIVSYKDYVAGWIDVSIHHFLEHLSPVAADIRFALVTCLDSNPDPASLLGKSPELKSIAKRSQVLGPALLLSTEVLLHADSSAQIFFGFDEIWFFPDKSIRPKPESLSIVGPARLNQVRLRKLGKWMSENDCSMALGSGQGLNFVVRAQGMARYLLGYSIEQPGSFYAPLQTAGTH
jgi:hypothetical protein